MSGFDPEAIVDALAALFDPDVHGVNVHGFVPAAPQFPALGVFPAAEFITEPETMDQFASMNVELRTAFTFDAEDSLRLIYRLLARGAGHDVSLANVLADNRTLGGLVHDVTVGAVQVRAGGEENAGLFEGVIAVRILVDFEEP